MTETRKLAAILAADVVGFSRLASTARTERWRGWERCAAI
jgi:class 3 adenylate cyclase